MPTQQQFFVKKAAIVATPSDSNDGRDPLGLALATATWVAATRTLTEAGKFANVIPGDLLTITGGTGATTGTYIVETVPNQDSCTLTESLSGVDLNTGDIKSSNGPFATLTGAVTARAAGDTINVCADGVHEPTDTVTWTDPSGAAVNMPWLRGVSARGVWAPFITQAVISSEQLATTKDLLHINMANPFVRISDLEFTGSPTRVPPTGGRDLLDVGGTFGFVQFDRVDVTYSRRHGMSSSVNSTAIRFADSRIYRNDGWGLMSEFVGAGNYGGVRTVLAYNGLSAAWAIGGAGGVYLAGRQGAYGHPGLWAECLFYQNGGPGALCFTGDGYEYSFYGCHFDGNGGASQVPAWSSGIVADDSMSGGGVEGGITIENTNFSNNAGYGVTLYTLGQVRSLQRTNFWQNGQGDSNLDIASVAIDELMHLDPLFLSRVAGLEDYRMADASPLQQAGIGCRIR